MASYAKITPAQTQKALGAIKQKHIRKFIRSLVSGQDARCVIQGNNHIRIQHPDGGGFTISSTASDARLFARIQNDAVKYGGFVVAR